MDVITGMIQQTQDATQPLLSVVIPVYNGGQVFARCLGALYQSNCTVPWELVVVNDGSTDDSVQIAQAYSAQVLDTTGREGPAAARNLGAQAARGAYLFFIDADCEVHRDTLSQLSQVLHQRPDVDAVFGSYDDAPGASNFVAQYKNLLHHYIHQTSHETATTFWTGCGAIKRDIFLKLGGFDVQQFPRPSVEDIELGYRIKQAGGSILLAKQVQVKHHKAWTLSSLIKTDVCDRALPWTRLLLSQQSSFTNDLNLQMSSRLSVAMVYASLALMLLSPVQVYSLFAAVLLMVGLLGLNSPIYRFFYERRGFRFMLVAIALHWLYYLYSGGAFIAAYGLHLGDRGWRLIPALIRSQPSYPHTPLPLNPQHAPLVSVIIPAYNAAAFIAQTLQSVLTQTYTSIEVLVVDDGSTDATADIVGQIASGDRRVRLIQQQNSGVAAARNLAIEQAAGEFIAPIDADDIWYPQHLEYQVGRMTTAPASVGVIYSWSLDINASGTPTGGFCASKVAGNVYRTLVCHNFIGNASATLIRRSCLEQVGGYSNRLRQLQAQGCEDWDLYLRLAERFEFQPVLAFSVGYRKISSSMSRSYEAMAKSHDLMLQFAHGRNPKLPQPLCQLSRSSFYLYLARQSRQHQCYRGTLYWLGQAYRQDPITPLIRFGVYTLLAESFIRLALKEIAAWVGPDTHYWLWLKNFGKQLLHQNSYRHKSDLGVYLKVLIGTILHKFIPLMYSRSPKFFSS